MPVTVSAKKALRRDRRRAKVNARLRRLLAMAIRKVKQQPTEKRLAAVYRTVDRAAKTGLMHKNKAARLKSRVAKRVAIKPKVIKKPVVKTEKKVSRRKSSKGVK